MGKQITVRDVPPELARRLTRLAKLRGASVNATVLDLLTRATGIDGRRERLAKYTTWTRDDVNEFERALRGQRTIDPDLWK